MMGLLGLLKIEYLFTTRTESHQKDHADWEIEFTTMK